MNKTKLAPKEMKAFSTKKGLLALLSDSKLNPSKAVEFAKYEKRIEQLQEE
ncbi:MAG: polyphosphate kinase 2, partial [Balneolaceae bacterium]